MKVNINYDANAACLLILKEQLERLNIKYQLLDLGEIKISNTISEKCFEELQTSLNKYSIFLLNDQKEQLIQKIKVTIIEMMAKKNIRSIKTSYYLSEKLNLTYGYISGFFSENTGSSIENFIIQQKIESAKKLIIQEELTLTKISYELNYCNVSHLSSQFKKVTGLTPSMFKRTARKRQLVMVE